MISILKNIDDLVYAYIEWDVVDKDLKLNNQGEYMLAQNIWVHDGFRGTDALKDLIIEVDRHPCSKQIKYIYWQVLRDENNDKIIDDKPRSVKKQRVSRLYKKEYIKNKILNKEF